MSKYFVIGYDECYPLGGFRDCQGIFDSVEDAEKYVKTNIIAGKWFESFDHTGIFEIKDNRPILLKEWQFNEVMAEDKWVMALELEELANE